MADEKQGRGFGGFGGMVSDVSDIAPPSPVKKHDDDDTPWIQSKAQRQSFGAKWKIPLIWVSVVGGLIGLGYYGDQHKAYLPPPTEEIIPALGTSNLLSESEIRYCMAQNIRLDGARTMVNHQSQFDIDSYNAMIADHNSRCGNFRYRQGTLDPIKAAVAASRQRYFSEGVAQFSTGQVGPRAYR